MNIIQTTTPKAAKHYICCGREQLIRNDNFDPEVSSSIKNCKGIEWGNKYFRQVYAEDGELHEFKSCLGCWETIKRFKLWEE